MKKENYHTSIPSLVNMGKIAWNVLMIAASIYFGCISNSWILWGLITLFSTQLFIGKLVSYFSKVFFEKEYITFFDQRGTPRKIAYDTIIGIYDTPKWKWIPFVNFSNIVRIQFLSPKGRLCETTIEMKDYDAIYCELIAHCPKVPFVSNEYDNPLFRQHYKHNSTISHAVFIVYALIIASLLAGTLYTSMDSSRVEDYITPLFIALIGIGGGVILFMNIRKMDKLFNAK